MEKETHNEIYLMLGEIKTGISEINKRLDKQNGRMEKLEDKTDNLESFRDNLKGKVAIVSSIGGGAMALLVTWLKGKLDL